MQRSTSNLKKRERKPLVILILSKKELSNVSCLSTQTGKENCLLLIGRFKMLSFLKKKKSDQEGSLVRGSFRETTIRKAAQNVRARRRNLTVQFCHFIYEEMGLERGNDLAKRTKLVSDKARSTT